MYLKFFRGVFVLRSLNPTRRTMRATDHRHSELLEAFDVTKLWDGVHGLRESVRSWSVPSEH